MKKEERRFRDIIRGFSKARIAVIGDLVADRYIFGKPFKLSREAPVLVVRHDRDEILPGGAGNAVNNLLALGASVYPAGVVGKDEFGRFLLAFFRKKGADTSGVLAVPGRETISKTRIMAGDDHTSKQQVIRIDREPVLSLDGRWRRMIVQYLREIQDTIDALIVSDYGYGVIDDEVRSEIRRVAGNIPVVVDSRYQLEEYAGVTAVTPNESEAELSSGMRIRGDRDVVAVGKKLRKRLKVKAVLITRGNKGMILIDDKGRVNTIPICGSDQVTDVTGAGDTVTSVFTLSLVAGASFLEAARLSNYAGGIVVMKRGAATLISEELKTAIAKDLGG
jgi:rfaE bifunctional protein kinase chain/domain